MSNTALGDYIFVMMASGVHQHDAALESGSGMMFKEWLLREQVYGALATAYHRTRSVKDAQNIGMRGFRPGKGDHYGMGVYMTYDLKSQLNQYMWLEYGPVIVRSHVNLQGFLILDREIAQLVYGEYDVEGQIYKLFGRSFGAAILKHVGGSLKTMDRFTSDLASLIANFSLKLHRHYVLKGMVFTGRSDGKVLVVYDMNAIIPVSYAETNISDKEPDIKWRNMRSNDHVRQVIQARARGETAIDSTPPPVEKPSPAPARMRSTLIQDLGYTPEEIPF